MEIAADPKKMRKIAKKLLDEAESGNMVAIKEVFDRLDGKPAQTVDMNVDDKRTSADWSRNELVDFLTNAANSSGGASEEDGRSKPAGPLH